MDHIIKEFIDFRMPIASLGAKVVLWGPIQGTITSEIEMKRINSRKNSFSFILLFQSTEF